MSDSHDGDLPKHLHYSHLIIFVLSILLLISILIIASIMYQNKQTSPPLPIQSNIVTPTVTETKGCATGGCSGELCIDADKAGGMMSSCIYRPEYKCLAQSKCEKQSDGKCGWTKTPEYIACLNTIKSSPNQIPQ